LSSEFDGSDGGYIGEDVALKKPSPIFNFLGIFSVVIGGAAGIYGVATSASSSNSQEYLAGILGYLLTAVIPIILLQLIIRRHKLLMNNNHDEPYDFYAGERAQTRFRKVVLVGLILAAPGIWILFLPIAEKFAA